MNRGSASDGQADASSLHGFNEAPIHESGKSAGSGLPGPDWTGFNEAPIHESGKSK